MKEYVVSFDEEFKLDENGLLLALKLIEERINNDIQYEKNKKIKLKSKINNIVGSGFFKDINRERLQGKLLTQEQIIECKELWLKNWKDRNKEKLYKSNLLEFSNMDKEFFLRIVEAGDSLGFKRFTVLQEVLLIPLYIDDDGKQIADEKTLEYSARCISKMLGLYENDGIDIIRSIDKFTKEINGFWSRVIKIGILGAGLMALIAFASVPFIATTVGSSILGLNGAAAFTGGLALIGGGSIASGGLGMTGGYTIIAGAGSILGMAGGSALGKKMSKVDIDYLLVSMVKTLNSIKYLKREKYRDTTGASNRIIHKFLRIKHELERDIILNNEIDNYKDVKDKIKIINYTFDEICSLL